MLSFWRGGGGRGREVSARRGGAQGGRRVLSPAANCTSTHLSKAPESGAERQPDPTRTPDRAGPSKRRGLRACNRNSRREFKFSGRAKRCEGAPSPGLFPAVHGGRGGKESASGERERRHAGQKFSQVEEKFCLPLCLAAKRPNFSKGRRARPAGESCPSPNIPPFSRPERARAHTHTYTGGGQKVAAASNLLCWCACVCVTSSAWRRAG